MKTILKTKSHIFTDFWKDDLKLILSDVSHDLSRMAKEGKTYFKNIKQDGIKVSLSELADSTADTLLIFKVLPSRIKLGFSHFKEDLSLELENQPDQKQKTIFTLKVIGALTSFTLETIYSVKKGGTDFAFSGLKRRNALTQLIVAEIVFKISRSIMLRLLNELAQQVSDPEDLKHINYFHELLSNKEKLPTEDILQNGDSAIEIVENLKRYIMTGKRGIE